MTTSPTTAEPSTPVAPAATAVSQAEPEPQPPAETRCAPEAITADVTPPVGNHQGRREDIGTIAAGESSADRGITRLTELNQQDVSYLDERVSIVTEAAKSRISACIALHEIKTYRDGLLWKREAATFEDFCKKTFGWQKTYAYAGLDVGRFASEVMHLSPCGGKLPVNEGQLRKFLTIVPEDHQPVCWTEITADKDPSILSGSAVAAEARKYLEKKGIPPKPGKLKKSKTAETSLADEALRDLKKLGIKLEKLLIPGTYEHLISSIEALITESSQNPDCTLESSSPDPVEQGCQERLGLTGSSLGGDRTPTPVTPGEGRTAPTDQPDAEGVITANRVANIMAGLDSADEQSCVPSPEENHSARAETHSASTPPPPAPDSVAVVNPASSKTTKGKSKTGDTRKPTVTHDHGTPDFPSMDQTVLKSSEEFPKKGWWVKRTSDDVVVQGEELRVYYQLMDGDEPTGNPADGEIARKRFEASAEKLNNMSNE